MVTIYFVRHGESIVNITHEFSYRFVDKSLTEKGKTQAAQAARMFQNLKIDAIYSSPLLRAKETAEIIQQMHPKRSQIPLTILEAFREVNVGELELMPPSKETWDLFFVTWKKWAHGDRSARFPQGENYHELLARMQAGLRDVLLEAAKTPSIDSVVIVGHGGIFMETLPNILTNLNFEFLEDRSWPNTAVTIAEMGLNEDRIEGKMIEYAKTDHLSGDAANLESGVPDQN